MVIARWINEDSTQYAILENDGSIAVANRSSSWEVWGPPIKLVLTGGFPSIQDFITTCMLQGNMKAGTVDAS